MPKPKTLGHPEHGLSPRPNPLPYPFRAPAATLTNHKGWSRPGARAFMAQEKQRPSTAFYCHKCRRHLHNTGSKGKRDTVSFTEKKDLIVWRHDGCGGTVSAG